MSREKQIEEMVKIAKDAIDNQSIDKCPFTPCRYRGCSVCCDVCLTIEAFYNAGYRKQNEGEWEPSDIPQEKYVCSVCGGACWYYDFQGDVAKSRYCPNCGSKMKGGE